MTTYTIQASFRRDGKIIDCTQPEVIPDAYGKEYATEAEAIAVAESEQDAIDDAARAGDLDESTTVEVYCGSHKVWPTA